MGGQLVMTNGLIPCPNASDDAEEKAKKRLEYYKVQNALAEEVETFKSTLEPV